MTEAVVAMAEWMEAVVATAEWTEAVGATAEWAKAVVVTAEWTEAMEGTAEWTEAVVATAEWLAGPTKRGQAVSCLIAEVAPFEQFESLLARAGWWGADGKKNTVGKKQQRAETEES